MTAGSIFAGFNRSVSEASAGFEAYLRRPGAVPILIIVLWACAVLPNLPLRAFIYEDGTNAEIARDILARGDFLQPYVYGVRWHEKPSLLSWPKVSTSTSHGGGHRRSASATSARPTPRRRAPDRTASHVICVCGAARRSAPPRT